jgi:hypothetical protein
VESPSLSDDGGVAGSGVTGSVPVARFGVVLKTRPADVVCIREDSEWNADKTRVDKVVIDCSHACSAESICRFESMEEAGSME